MSGQASSSSTSSRKDERKAGYGQCGTPPSIAVLGALYDQLPKEADGLVGAEGVRAALDWLHANYCSCLGRQDAVRLLNFLSGGAATVGRTDFQRGLCELLGVMSSLGDNITASGLKFILAACFERFDANGDGVLQPEEFRTALGMLQLGITDEQTSTLSRFYAQQDDVPIQQETLVDDRPFWEKWASALDGSLESLRQYYGFSTVLQLVDDVGHAARQDGSLEERAGRVGRACCNGAEQLVDTVELFLEMGAMVLAAELLGFEGLTPAGLDESTVDPLVVLLGLGAVGVAKELDELVPHDMNQDEAMLYAQLFHGSGLSQAQFRRLLNCQGCHWRTVDEGEYIGAVGNTSSVRLIARGQALVSSGTYCRTLKQGAVLGAVEFLAGKATDRANKQEALAVALEPVTIVEWEPSHLREFLDHEESLACHFERLMAASVLADLAALEDAAREACKASATAFPGDRADPCADARMLCADAPEGDGDLLSSFQSAWRMHVERKGFTRFGYLGRQVVAAANEPGDLTSKAQRVLRKLWDSSQDLVSFKKALADILGTCSALVGVWQELSCGAFNEGDLVRDELDLLPFVLSIGLCGVHALRHVAKGDIADLPEQEAAAYNQLFRQQGFSVAEFQSLLRHGAAEWQALDPGERLPLEVPEGRLRLLVRGQGRVIRAGLPMQVATPGRLLGVRRFMGLGEDEVSLATLEEHRGAVLEATSSSCLVLALNGHALEEHLKCRTGLKAKVQHLVSSALARRLADLRQDLQDAEATGPWAPDGQLPWTRLRTGKP